MEICGSARPQSRSLAPTHAGSLPSARSAAPMSVKTVRLHIRVVIQVFVIQSVRIAHDAILSGRSARDDYVCRARLLS